jgi:hypothetical protein
MNRIALPLLFVLAASCTRADDARERIGVAKQTFTSAEATLVDLEVEGRLVTDTDEPAALRRLVTAQLLYAVGQLNEERSVGWYERLELSAITATPSEGATFDVGYRAKLPVAWGASSIPTTYTLRLPAAVSPADQLRFTMKYGTSCVAADAGDLNAGDRPDAGRMFLFYRPQRDGCALAPEDIETMTAKVTRSAGNTAGKYPEYHRIWEDAALDVVAIFGIEAEDKPSDAGVKAFEDFLVSSAAHLASLQPDESTRRTTRTIVDGRRRARLEATLPDARAVHIDAILIGPRVQDESGGFDAWYEAATPNADVIFYSGHAGHGANVHAIMSKGTFRAAKYLLFAMNGCDTLAYLDRTLADRRAALNPEDRSGTKYMDTVSNVLGAWFRTGDETAMRFVEAMTSATGPDRSPRTYREILSTIDRDQVGVVTGEEDNEFPIAKQTSVVSAPEEQIPPGPPSGKADGDGDGAGSGAGCLVAPANRSRFDAVAFGAAAAVALAVRRRSRMKCASGYPSG